MQPIVRLPQLAAGSARAVGPCLVPGLVAAMLCGCSALRGSHKAEKVEVKALQPASDKVVSATPSSLQSLVMRFADDFAARVAQTADDVSTQTTNVSVRVAALKWKLELAGAAYVNGSGRNPILNALDMVVLASLSRMLAESEAVEGRYQGAFAPFVETHRRLETNAWKLVDGVLKPGQKTELRDMIRDWRIANPGQRHVGAVRFREFAVGIGNTPQASSSKPTSVFNLLFIDPMAGLDPTTRAIEETRQSAERITYYAQRAPVLWSWQMELLAYQLTDEPAAKQLLADAQRVSLAAEKFADAAEKLPAVVEEQREAAVKQVFDGLATERSNIFAGFSAKGDELRGLLSDTRGVLDAGGQMATNLDQAIQSLHGFVYYVSPGLHSNAVPSKPSTITRPFDVLDYGKTATQIAAMANDLNRLITTVNESVPQTTQLSRQAQANLEQVMDRAFRLGLLLTLVFLVGSVAAGLSYRVLARKLGGEPRTDSGNVLKEAKSSDVSRYENKNC